NGLQSLASGGPAPPDEPLRKFWTTEAFTLDLGMPGQAWARQQPVIVADLRQTDLPEARYAGAFRGAIGVPVLTRRGGQAVLALSRTRPGAPKPQEVAALVYLARQVARFLVRRHNEDAIRASEPR